MKKFLILAIAFAAACSLHAQNPISITLPKDPVILPHQSTPDIPCNNAAGTFTLGATGVNTQSNDLTLDTLFLCSNDSIFIDHNGDFNLSGDPNPATPPGVGYAFYTCPPTATGPTLQNIIGSALPPPPIAPDPCLLNNPPAANGLYVTSSNPNGDTWFFNSGFLQTTFNGGMPLLLHFAPITFDDATNNGYEPATQGAPPGPCVNVNTAAQFEVVYLNPIQAIGFTTPFQGNSCLGRFRLDGGYPEWDPNASYTVDIYLQSDPSVKALINNPVSQLKQGVSLIFSVPQSGTYVISIEDGKSCGFMQVVDMTACTATDNVGFILPSNLQAEPGETFCIPITTSNFNNVQGFSISLQWDPTLLQLLPDPNDFIQNINPDLIDFDPNTGTNTSEAGNGFLGIANAGSIPATLSTTETLMEVCFLVISTQDSICTPLGFINNPSAVNATNNNGQSLAVEGTDGLVCILYDTVAINAVALPLGCNPSSFQYNITITGGEAPYELTWQELPSGSVPSASGIASNTPFLITLSPVGGFPATYRLIATPQNGVDIINADTFLLVVNQPQTLGAALNLSGQPSCNGLSDGSVTAQVFLGTTEVTDPVALAGYSFSWTKNLVPVPGTGPVLTGVSAGVFAVTITDNSTGCTAVASGTLGNPAVLDNGTVTITPATCTGVADGSLSYEMEGGNPFGGGLYQFDIFYAEDCANPNKVLVESGSLGNPYSRPDLLPGCYKLVVEDANGCVFTDSVVVAATRTVNLDELSVTAPLCFGEASGVLAVEVTETPAQPGGPAYFFSWIPIGSAVGGIITPAGPSATSTNTGVSAGSFFVTAVDAIGCSDTLTVMVGQPDTFQVTPLTVNNPTCPNPSAGSISVLALGGTGNPANFTYAWSPAGAGPAISGLVEGTYTVTATDVNGCTAVFDTTLALPLPPVIVSIDSMPVNCGSDGSLTVVAPSATSYSWEAASGTPVPNADQATISNLVGDTYTVTITDANGCTNTASATLTPVEPLSISSTTLTDPSCFGYNDGSIAIGVLGGNSPYNYNWSTPLAPPNSPVVPLLTAGTYTVTVSDTKNCTLTASYTLTDPPQIQVLVVSSSPTSCFGACDGEITIAANYVPGADFNFVWQDGGSSDSIRTDLCSGMTSVTITEQSAAQCFIIQDITVASPPAVSVDPVETSIKNVTCNGGSDGNVCISGIGGNGGPYTYVWAQGGTTNCLFNLSAGAYAVTITDVDGCTGTYSAMVGEPPIISVSQDEPNSLPISCFGDDDGALAVIATGGNIAPPGTTQYTYIWSDGTNQVGTTNPLSMLVAGTYSVTVTDYLGCTGTTSLNLFDPPAVQGEYVLGAPLQCFGDETTITITSVMGGAGAPYTYTIDFGVPISTDLTSAITGGPHSITYLDQKGCENTVEIDIPEPDPIIVTFDPAFIEIELGDSLTLTPLITGAVVSSFEWTPADFFRSVDTLQPTLYTFESGTVTLTVTDANGCTGVGSVRVEVDPNRNVYIPNIFIPGNRFGVNDYFIPGVGLGVENINYMRVYNRWGELLYERDDFLPSDLELTTGWDGRFRGKFVEPGVYVYAIEVKFLDGKVLLYRGDITVVR